MIDVCRMKEVLNYNEASGIFSWKKSLSNRTKVGEECRAINNNGYIVIRVDGNLYYAHRLAWLYMYSTFPSKYIDHIDHNRQNNAIENLRDTEKNCKNKSLYSNNTSGYHGITYTNDKWKAVIGHNNTNIFLGYYNTKEEAIIARRAAERVYYYHINHGN